MDSCSYRFLYLFYNDKPKMRKKFKLIQDANHVNQFDLKKFNQRHLSVNQLTNMDTPLYSIDTLTHIVIV